MVLLIVQEEMQNLDCCLKQIFTLEKDNCIVGAVRGA